MILEEAGADPGLCLGPVLESMPPQCQGVTVDGWDWDIEHEGSTGSPDDVRWGSYVLVGTWDGERFTLTEPAVVADQGDGVNRPRPDYSSPCPEPEGSWVPLDPERTTDETRGAAIAVARQDEGFGGGWVDRLGHPIVEETANDPKRLVLNVTTTGDTSALDAAMREVWGGALCVSRAERTDAELARIQEELGTEPGSLGRGRSSVEGTVWLDLVVATEQRQAELDEQYGPGAVRLEGALQPID